MIIINEEDSHSGGFNPYIFFTYRVLCLEGHVGNFDSTCFAMILDYCKNIIRGRLKPLEKSIASSALYSYYYAFEVIKGRFPAGEAAIANTREIRIACSYAVHVVKGRWEPGEHVIALYGWDSLKYAADALHARFPACEPGIINTTAGGKYCRHFKINAKELRR